MISEPNFLEAILSCTVLQFRKMVEQRAEIVIQTQMFGLVCWAEPHIQSPMLVCLTQGATNIL